MRTPASSDRLPGADLARLAQLRLAVDADRAAGDQRLAGATAVGDPRDLERSHNAIHSVASSTVCSCMSSSVPVAGQWPVAGTGSGQPALSARIGANEGTSDPRAAAPARRPGGSLERLRAAHSGVRPWGGPAGSLGRPAMPEQLIYNTAYSALAADDSVGDATRRMLADRVSDLPVVDADGRLVGMFKLDRLFASLLPKAALLGYGMPDLAFVSDSLGRAARADARGRRREACAISSSSPITSSTRTRAPLEIVLLLYKGANNIPVVDARLRPARRHGRGARRARRAARHGRLTDARHRAHASHGDLRLEPAVGGDGAVRRSPTRSS